MMRILTLVFGLLAATPALAQDVDLTRVIDGHILPGFETLAQTSEELAEVAQNECNPASADLRIAYGQAFDSFVAVSHLRFGPTETDNRGFALAFWPDPRGSTPKTLAKLVADADPIGTSPETYQEVSVAARGFYALEFLLYAPQFTEAENTGYICSLIQTVTSDIAGTSQAILTGWTSGYADLIRTAGRNDTFRSKDEATRQLFTALSTGLEFTSSARLGRPLGSFDRPRPKRAEVWRSGRSLRHVQLSLAATRDLAAILSGNEPEIDAAFARAIEASTGINDPDFAGVADPQSRLRIEALKLAVDTLRQRLALDLGPRLGVAAGFNSLDGD